MNTTDTIGCENVDPEEVIRRLKRLLEYLEKKRKMNSYNEEELQNSSMDGNRA